MWQANNKRALLLAAQFLHEELPIRLARRARELKKLPFGLAETESMMQVRLPASKNQAAANVWFLPDLCAVRFEVCTRKVSLIFGGRLDQRPWN